MAAPVNAAKFGKVSVMSEVGQPVAVEIEVLASESDKGALQSRLIAPAAQSPAADQGPDLAVRLEQHGERKVLRITSAQPLAKSDLNVMIELLWSGGTRLGEYLLRFPVSAAHLERMAQQAASEARSFPVQPQTIEEAPALPQKADAPDTLAQPTTGLSAQSSGGNDAAPQMTTWLVRQGNTLGRIAQATQHRSTLPEQMFLAIFRANPDAFVERDAAHLSVGKVLTIPGEQAVAAIDRTEALAFYAAQADRQVPAGLASPLPPYVARETPARASLNEPQSAPNAMDIKSPSVSTQLGQPQVYASMLEKDVSELQKSSGISGNAGRAGVAKNGLATVLDFAINNWFVVGISGMVLLVCVWLKRRSRNAKNST